MDWIRFNQNTTLPGPHFKGILVLMLFLITLFPSALRHFLVAPFLQTKTRGGKRLPQLESIGESIFFNRLFLKSNSSRTEAFFLLLQIVTTPLFQLHRHSRWILLWYVLWTTPDQNSCAFFLLSRAVMPFPQTIPHIRYFRCPDTVTNLSAPSMLRVIPSDDSSILLPFADRDLMPNDFKWLPCPIPLLKVGFPFQFFPSPS